MIFLLLAPRLSHISDIYKKNKTKKTLIFFQKSFPEDLLLTSNYYHFLLKTEQIEFGYLYKKNFSNNVIKSGGNLTL